MNPFSSRAYDGAADLPLLVEFAQTTTGARWPSATYQKVGDVVWMLYAAGFDPNVRLWFAADGLAAYAWFEPPASLDFGFDIRTCLSRDDSLADEILEWAEERRQILASVG